METEHRLPEFLEIFGRRFRIEPMPTVNVNDGVIGMAAYSEGVIYIDGEIEPALALSTLWHEAVHIAQIDLHGKTDEKEARWVSVFAHALLMHNPWILEAYGEIQGMTEHIKRVSGEGS
ncbi:MAG: hypothetical protein V1792_24140 [Pseudomonadota bacterium]